MESNKNYNILFFTDFTKDPVMGRSSFFDSLHSLNKRLEICNAKIIKHGHYPEFPVSFVSNKDIWYSFLSMENLDHLNKIRSEREFILELEKSGIDYTTHFFFNKYVVVIEFLYGMTAQDLKIDIERFLLYESINSDKSQEMTVNYEYKLSFLENLPNINYFDMAYD